MLQKKKNKKRKRPAHTLVHIADAMPLNFYHRDEGNKICCTINLSGQWNNAISGCKTMEWVSIVVRKTKAIDRRKKKDLYTYNCKVLQLPRQISCNRSKVWRWIFIVLARFCFVFFLWCPLWNVQFMFQRQNSKEKNDENSSKKKKKQHTETISTVGVRDFIKSYKRQLKYALSKWNINITNK